MIIIINFKNNYFIQEQLYPSSIYLFHVKLPVAILI